MNIYDTYGLTTKDLEEAKESLENLLGISLQPHESEYMGGLYYRTGLPGKESYVLQKNDCEEEGWTEEEYQELGAILRVSKSTRADLVREVLLNSSPEKILHIRRGVIIENSPEDRWSKTYHFLNGKDILISEERLPETDWFKKK
jgi:hypothetical protein